MYAANPLSTIVATLKQVWDIAPSQWGETRFVSEFSGRWGEFYTLEASWYQYFADKKKGRLVLEYYLPFCLMPRSDSAKIARFMRVMNEGVRRYKLMTLAFRTARRQFCFSRERETEAPYVEGPSESVKESLYHEICFTQLSYPLWTRFLREEELVAAFVDFAYMAAASDYNM